MAVALTLSVFRLFEAWGQHGVPYAIQHPPILHPQTVLVASQAVVWRTVDAPLSEGIADGCGPEIHFQIAVDHAVVQDSDLRPGLIGVRYQDDLYDMHPLDVLVAAFVIQDRCIR